MSHAIVTDTNYCPYTYLIFTYACYRALVNTKEQLLLVRLQVEKCASLFVQA